MSGGDRRVTYTSPPCFAHEVDPAYFDPTAVDPQQAADVARWRKAERKRLRAERAAISVAARTGIAEALARYRLGYGGGYFDRTLAALSPRPFTIGVGLQEARLETIYPQPHDVRLDAIVTEAGVQFSSEGLD